MPNPASSPFLLRAPGVPDARALAEVMEGIYAEGRWFVGDGPPEVAVLRRRIERLDPSREFILLAVAQADAESVILGWVEARRLAFQRVEHVANLTLAVAASARGQGIGRSLLRAVEPWARRVGIEKLRLDVRGSNAPAIALYESEGFQLEGTERAFVREPNGYDDNRIYGKFLIEPPR